jgi:hypothetical protein
MRNDKGSAALLIQNFRNGCAVVARNFMCFVCKIKVVMFQLIINTPTANPTIAILSAFTFERYSGARKRELAPYGCRKFPLTVAKSIYQKMSNTW